LIRPSNCLAYTWSSTNHITYDDTNHSIPWTWWTPVDKADDSDENAKKKDDIKSTADMVTEKGIETTSKKIDEELTTMITIITDDDFNETEAVTKTSTIDDMITTEAIELEAVTAQNTATANEETNQEMKDKYLKLVEHNSQLVEILRATMQVQSDLFRRILKYMFH
jgi:hypothetical protein